MSYRGRWIDAGSDLLKDSEIAESFDGSTSDLLFNPSLSPFAVGQVRLNKETFYVTPGDYEIVFQWGNEDGEFFRDTVRVYLDL